MVGRSERRECSGRGNARATGARRVRILCVCVVWLFLIAGERVCCAHVVDDATFAAEVLGDRVAALEGLSSLIRRETRPCHFRRG